MGKAVYGPGLQADTFTQVRRSAPHFNDDFSTHNLIDVLKPLNSGIYGRLIKASKSTTICILQRSSQMHLATCVYIHFGV